LSNPVNRQQTDRQTDRHG